MIANNHLCSLVKTYSCFFKVRTGVDSLESDSFLRIDVDLVGDTLESLSFISLSK